MKKINKIFAATTASLLCLSSMTALSGNAVFWTGIPNDEEKALEIIRENMFYDTDTFKDFALDTERVFATPNTVVYFTSNRGMCRIEANTRVLDFSMKTASSFSKEDTETVKAFLNELYPDVEFDVKMDGKAKFSIFDINALPFDGRLDKTADAEVIYDFVAEHFDVESCKFNSGYVSPQRGSIDGYVCTGDEKLASKLGYYSEETPAILQNYIEEKGLNIKLKTDNPYNNTSYPCCIVTNNLTSKETLQLYTDIYNDLGLKPSGWYEDSEVSIGEPLNLCKTDGDANTDGVLGIADATLILQYLTNKDEYDLTEQGAYNADLDKDGITANDALVIQQMLAEQEK